MPLPTVPTAPATTVTASAPAAASTPAATTASEPAKIKQFGPAKDAAGATIPAPTPLGFDLVDISKNLWESLKTVVASKGADINAFISACELDKPTVPGHKEGRIAYNTANLILNLSRSNGLLNKQRGATGMALANQKIAALDKKTAALRALLIKLGQSEAEIEKTLAEAAA